MTAILSENYVKTNVIANDWKIAIKEVGNILVKEGDCSEEFITSMIETVEKLGAYMILLPDIALFHAPPGDYVFRPCLSFATFKEAVYFKEFENKRIKCAFALGATDANSHMELIKIVAMLLQNEEFIELSTHSANKEEIMKCMQDIIHKGVEGHETNRIL